MSAFADDQAACDESMSGSEIDMSTHESDNDFIDDTPAFPDDGLADYRALDQDMPHFGRSYMTTWTCEHGEDHTGVRVRLGSGLVPLPPCLIHEPGAPTAFPRGRTLGVARRRLEAVSRSPSPARARRRMRLMPPAPAPRPRSALSLSSDSSVPTEVEGDEYQLPADQADVVTPPPSPVLDPLLAAGTYLQPPPYVYPESSSPFYTYLGRPPPYGCHPGCAACLVDSRSALAAGVPPYCRCRCRDHGTPFPVLSL